MEAYQVILTLTLTDADHAAEVPLLLAPTDSLPLSDGGSRRLADCTLGDLRAYAEALADDVWATYQDIRLPDLDAQDAVRVEMRSAIDGVSLPATVLAYRVLPATLSELAAAAEAGVAMAADAAQPAIADAETPPAAADPGGDQAPGEPQGATVDPETPDAVAPPLVEDQPAPDSGEAPAGDAPGPEIAVPEDLPADEPEPEIDVGETEPLVAEREAPAEAPPTPPPGPIRILGRRRPLGHPTWTAVDILINEPAFRDAQAHALSSLDREVAGILVGPPPEKQPDGRYVVHVSDIIIARHTRMSGASVTYTPESWRYVNDKLAERYPEGDAVIVGWYHTHPGFGIFLSGMDQFIHQHFFTQLWHIAFVLDPRARKTGFFCWNRQRTQVDQYEFPWPEWAAHGW